MQEPDARYDSLLAKYKDLELRITRFSLVEQQLAHARDQLDKEVTIHSRMHRFNREALKELSSQSFADLASEALVDVFEVEIGFFWACGLGGSTPATAGTLRAQLSPESCEAIAAVLWQMNPSGTEEWLGVLSESALKSLSPVLEMSWGMTALLRDEMGRPLLALLAGNSVARERFYEPISSERTQAFALFAQQVAAHLAQHRNRRTIRAQLEELEESQKKLRLLGDNLPNGFVFQLEMDRAGRRRVLYASAGIERIHNMTLGEVALESSRLYDQIVPEDRETFFRKENEAIVLNRPFSMEYRIRSKRDELRWVFMSCAFTRHEDGRIRWDGLELDITERKRLEERLQYSQKMESIGHLAGGVAHEFNNLLAAMIMYINLAQLNEPGEDCRPILSDVSGLCNRAANLVKQLLAFSRQSVLRMEPLELDAVVSDESRMLDRLLGERIRLEWSTVPNLPMIRADKGMVGQVLLNLCLNARDAMPNGGVLRISLKVVVITSPHESELLDIPPGQYVCMTVMDTGCGMDERVQQRLFEPFFTTKPVGQGTGLGLATVRGIIQQHRGALAVDTAAGKGTSFHIYLPAITVDKNPGMNRVGSPPSTPLATILFVEDEIAIRTPMVRYLQRSHYRVLEAGNAHEALTLWKEHASSIDVLMTDMVMPGDMTGLQLAELLVKAKPQLKVILASGYHSNVLDAGYSSGIALTFLSKPFMPEELCNTLALCLRTPSPK